LCHIGELTVDLSISLQLMHVGKKYRAEDERVMNEWDERKMKVAGVDSTYVAVIPQNQSQHLFCVNDHAVKISEREGSVF
jgi:hypothetical protein